MERAARVIGKSKAAWVSPEDLARAAWEGSVGKRLAGRTHAVALVRSRLVVEVEDDLWRRNLYGLQGQILSKLEQVLGSRLIEELEFRIRVPRIGPQSEQESARREKGDDADGILDPSLRLVYRNARKKAASA